jgi:rhamnogalacturonyl hydrolase YesR
MNDFKKSILKMKAYCQRTKRPPFFWGVTLYTVLIMSACTSSRKITSVDKTSREFAPNVVFHTMKKVANWQLDSIRDKGWRHAKRSWTNGALYAGLLAFARLANDSSYYAFMKRVGDQFDWQLEKGKNRYMADFYCVGQMYCGIYDVYRNPQMIADLKLLTDTLIARPHTESLLWKNGIQRREWAWCDALFMGPPSLAMLANVTGERKYMDLVDSLWWKTADYLYDPEEHLYFRDGSFLHKKEKNGKKVFWSRGNGWVMGGLVRVIQNMPKDYYDRGRWIKLYQDMAAKIATLQQPDGTWHASLLDPEAYPSKETSGTTFYCYALAWGINHGLLQEKRYAPVVWKAWKALLGCLHPNGKLGYVQYIAGSPGKVSYDDTEVYAVGAFLLAGSEVIKMGMEDQPGLAWVALSNGSAEVRDYEMAEIPLQEFSGKAKGFYKHSFRVSDAITGKQLPCQLIYHGYKKPQSLIFPVSLMPGTTHFYTIRKGASEKFTPQTYGRFVPERLDDYAWENDRIAFRMYGPALQKTGDISSGIDVWAKNTDSLVINKWYKTADYHRNHGEGLDAYDVGASLGDGATAPYVNNKLWQAKNYITHATLDNGPLRTTFRLTYAPFDVAGEPVTETRIISLDAGSQLNKVEDQYEWRGNSMPIAIGIAMHGNHGLKCFDTAHHVMGLWEVLGNKKNGMVGLGVVVPGDHQVAMKTAQDHLLAVTEYKKGYPFVYYQGAGWQKSGHFPNAQAWFDYLKSFSQRLQSPLKIEVE